MARSATRNGVHDSGEVVEPEWPTYTVRARLRCSGECMYMANIQDAVRNARDDEEKPHRFWGYFDYSHSRVFTPLRPVEGPKELNFARVGGGRPDLDLAEGRGVGTGPSVSIFGFPSGNSFWPIGPIEPGLRPTDPLTQAIDGGSGANWIFRASHVDTPRNETTGSLITRLPFDNPIRKQNSASAWRATMAPRQLRLELNEVDMTADKGSKRVRVDCADKKKKLVVP
eukprot:scaffold14897_cov108-Isochrysis_galbana.AAC.2